jgi:hypothetical protein
MIALGLLIAMIVICVLAATSPMPPLITAGAVVITVAVVSLRAAWMVGAKRGG